MKSLFPTTMAGCGILALWYFLAMAACQPLPLAILTMVIGPLAFLVPPLTFFIFNWWVLGRSTATITPYSYAMTAFCAVTVAGFSISFFARNWRGKGVYIEDATVISWAIIGVIMGASTMAFLSAAIYKRNAKFLVISHIVLFAWFFSFAFPWIAENL